MLGDETAITLHQDVANVRAMHRLFAVGFVPILFADEHDTQHVVVK
jgi:hypothetical protein